ncbi:MAG: lysozyme [Phenylobacterium sp.]
MKPRHQVSRAAITLIERFEGYRRKAAQLPDGRWTIGYGHTLTAREGAEVSADDAEALLLYDLIAVAHGVNEAVFTPLSQNQFDALCAFAFNVGLDRFRASSVLHRINEGALIQAACGMELWRKARFGDEEIVVDALVRRRAAEKALFLTPAGGEWTPVPSSAVRPLLDVDTNGAVPRDTPAQVETSLEGERVVVLREGEAAPPPLPPEEPEPEPATVTAAAEAVAARLATIFPESAVEPVVEVTGDEPFVLLPPDEVAGEPALPPPEPETRVPGPDLFDEPVAANDAAEPALDDLPPIPERRVVIDDIAPFEFVPARVHALPQKPRDGVLSLVALAVLGLAFLAGGLFWAAYARPGTLSVIDPRLVGGLACFAGIGLTSISAYLLLQRLGRAAERADH